MVEVRVISVNGDETATAILRGGGVESVRLSNLRRPDWWAKPRYWLSQGPRTIPRFRRPTYKDEMLKHGVAVTRVVNYNSDGSESEESDSDGPGIDDGHQDVMFNDYVASMELALGYN